MARIKGAMMTRKRRKKTLKLAKGYWGSKSKHFKMAKEQVMRVILHCAACATSAPNCRICRTKKLFLFPSIPGSAFPRGVSSKLWTTV